MAMPVIEAFFGPGMFLWLLEGVIEAFKERSA